VLETAKAALNCTRRDMARMPPALPKRPFHMVSRFGRLRDIQLITHLGRDNDFDVVLIDTAGRMQDNEVRGCVGRVNSI
jgi:hypothetical protein